ncbi:MAG: OmpH family outer membrane protein [Candidatus Tectomicrobia bacterium]|uniref:OmpH family outer membrane protein n=1 Tax=Tectimicrobiota bacterium TaxID=2528274 RepID=A0A932I019_UNCTE|nr:OmpH family outer membrane protein [Candidatus Tectomicrobia bacterium]
MQQVCVAIAGWLVFGALLLAGGATEAAAARIGVVNVQGVLSGSVAGKEATQALEKEKARLQDVIRAKKNEVDKLAKEAQTLQIEIEQKGAIWREEERNRKTADLRRQQRDILREQDELKRLVEDSQRDLAERQRQAITGIIKELRDVVHQIGRDDKYDLILDSTASGVLFATPPSNITDKVIQVYDSKKKK